MLKIIGILPLILTVLLLACGPQMEKVETLPKGGYVAILKEAPPPLIPPDPDFNQLTLSDVEELLSRISVRMSTWISLLTTDPKPLLSDLQVLQFGMVLTRELPRLAADQRLRFNFRDQYKNQIVVMDVHKEGVYLVFTFKFLSRGHDRGRPNLKSLDGGKIQPRPGQIFIDSPGKKILKVPIKEDLKAREKEIQPRLELVEKAKKAKTIDQEEEGKLREIISANPNLDLDALQQYLEKLKMLNSAHRQKLITQEELISRINKLRGKLLEQTP